MRGVRHWLMAAGVATLPLSPASAAKIEVFNPTEVSTDVFAWQVGLTITLGTGGFRCGGALISPRHVLTAAHCVDSAAAAQLFATGTVTAIAPAEVVVRKGADVFKDARSFAVTRVFIHPQWRQTGTPFEFDVAVLELAEPLSGRPIALRAKLSDDGPGEAWVSGWGATASTKQAQRLGAARVKLSDRAQCQGLLGMLASVTANMVCSVDPLNVHCEGDSGGPLVVGGLASPQLIGIVSAGMPMCGALLGSHGAAARVGLFTRVAAVASWVADVTDHAALLTEAPPGPLFALPKKNEI